MGNFGNGEGEDGEKRGKIMESNNFEIKEQKAVTYCTVHN